MEEYILVPNPIYDINESIIYFGSGNGPTEVKLNDGPNNMKFISPIFKTTEDSYNVEGVYFYPDTLLIPVKYIDSNTVNFTFNSWADIYLCNETTDFSFDIINLSPKSYDASIELTLVGAESLGYDTTIIIHQENMISPLETFKFNTLLDMPNESFSGDILDIKAKLLITDPVSQVLVDSTILDLSEILRCSFDPNDKAAFPVGILEEHYTLFDQPIQYRIRFQNTGNYPARDVVITDQLDEDLDWSTFKFVKASHDISSVDMEDGFVSFNFKGIQLPDSTNNEPTSHGYVMYSIDPKTDLPENTIITNQASIYFDQNAAVITNQTLNTLVSELPSTGVATNEVEKIDLKIYPNPLKDVLHISSDIKILKIDIYNNVGQYIKHYPIVNNTIDLSTLEPQQIYYLKIYTDNGIFTRKIVK